MTARPLLHHQIGDTSIAVFSDRIVLTSPGASWRCHFPPAVIEAGRRIARVDITSAMMAEAQRLVAVTQMHRTRANDHDALLGHIGELAWAQYRYGTVTRHRIGKNFGTADDGDFEVKISAVDYVRGHHLKIREDYLQRLAPIYIQMFIEDGQAGASPTIGQQVIIAGYLRGDEVHQLGHWVAETSDQGTFRTWSIPVRHLHSLVELDPFLKGGAA